MQLFILSFCSEREQAGGGGFLGVVLSRRRKNYPQKTTDIQPDVRVVILFLSILSRKSV